MLHKGVRFWLGLATGLVVGVGLGWFAASRVGRGGPASIAASADAGPEVAAPHASGKPRRKARRDQPGDDAPAPVVPASGRAMTWRGPTIELPPRDIDLGAEDTSRPLENSEIDGVIARSSDAVLGCIREALAGASLEGDVHLDMLVTGDGVVSQVRVGAARWLFDHGLAACATAAARRMRFPATGAPTVVDAPYHID